MPSGICVHNLKSGDELSYSLPLLIGEVHASSTEGFILIENCNRSRSWPVVNNRFKALVDLVPGLNSVKLSYENEQLIIVLHLRCPACMYFVRPIYIKCRDHSGEFQGPEDEDLSPESAIERISLAARMLQTFTAEKMNDQGFGRQTFALETDLYPSKPSCHIFESKLTIGEAHKMSGSDLWTHFARELMSSDCFQDDRNLCKWFAFMSFTRYSVPKSAVRPSSHSEILSYTKGHTALGGGGLALIGTGTLHCWSRDVGEVVDRFTDCRRIDKSRLMDDSAYREFYWANYATGIGAALHELGHTFDLAHSPTGVMARGFDDINRFFVVQPPAVLPPTATLPRSASPARHHSSVSSAAQSVSAAARSRLGSVGDGVPSSRDASPVPYSPKQSPVRRPSSTSMMECGRGSPVFSHCPGSSRLSCVSDVPAVVVVEAAFTRLQTQTSHTTKVKNYDGSEVTAITTRHRDGVETILEITHWPDDHVVLYELVRNLTSGKTRTTTSMTMMNVKPPQPPSLAAAARHGNSSSNCGVLGEKRSSPAAAANGTSSSIPPFHDNRYKHGGAHWYRSSAVMLHYHKWFNESTADNVKNAIEVDGNVVKCSNGIRLVELRYIPEGCVCHHWEFVEGNPPTKFVVCVDQLRHLSLPRNGTEVILVVEDSCGNVLKKRVTSNILQPHQ